MNDMEKQCITRKNEIKEMNEMGGGSSAEVRRENRRKVKELKRREKKTRVLLLKNTQVIMNSWPRKEKLKFVEVYIAHYEFSCAHTCLHIRQQPI